MRETYGRARHRRCIALAAALLAVCILALSGRSTPGRAQTAPTPTSGAGPALSLQATQHPTQAADGSPAIAVDLRFSAGETVQVRLLEDRGVLLFDGFVGPQGSSVSRTYPRLCGQTHQYVLYSIVAGKAARASGQTVVLCPEAVPAPSAAASGTPAAAGAAPGQPRPNAPAAAAPAATAAAPPSPAFAPIGAVQPGQPPVPAPPLEPPSLALSNGFVLAQPDDDAAASAMYSGVPLIRLTAIWLRGNDTSGGGGGAYQYVAISNLGGAAQDLSGWALQGDSGAIAGLLYYFPAGLTLNPGESCRVYVGHPAEATCGDGSFALFAFWGDHGTASLWDAEGTLVDLLGY
ncbi:MAG TPA: lamin tail domain-containing protein [Dehalococcoidia bacterium]|nr:lamin tail domain-containing protein [Dehalococcoidia bacterium]